ncbi:MAG: shikimate dehydrogenase [Actinomycetota bacterium]|nr:shikimate dehydrogenase [Actinomycetota bacterium]
MQKINGETKITGIIGYPLTYTLSPAMHNRAFEVCNLNYCYLPFIVESENLKTAIEGIRALKIKGINVTMPHKEAVIDFLDELSPEAEIIGAVNTIGNNEGHLIGYNTDGKGFLRSLEEESYNPSGKIAIILGTGGAAKAVAVALAEAGISEIIIVGRSKKKASIIKDALVNKLVNISISTLSFDGNLADKFQVGDLIVNATPVGMKGHGDLLPVPLELINKRHFVYDLVYTPQETTLMTEARKRGARVANGLGMLLHQAASAFEIWTGILAPVDAMRQALVLELESRERAKNARKKSR